jgi:hypothetical protein
MRRLLLVVIWSTACSPTHRDSGTDAGGDSCTGSETRCEGNSYQVCDGGVFTTQSTCPNSCAPNLGCVDCDPAAGNACNGNDVVTCNSDGSYGTTVMSCGAGMMCQAGGCSNSCTADGVDLIYAVDEANDFLSFDPRKLPGDPFTRIGTLSCPSNGQTIQVPPGIVSPFSMSVDRMGTAWVEYTTGEIFNVSITTAACSQSGYVPQSDGMALFGMGFVSDAQGADTEKLFIAGGGHSAEPMGKLDKIDTTVTPLAPTQVGMITAASDFSPELTGTSEAKLYGFFPVVLSGTASYVQEIDHTSGAPVGPKFPPAGFDIGAGGGSIRDWAFAQWGGRFYVFVSTDDGLGGNLTSRVYEIDKTSNTVNVVWPTSQFQVDGAGVSTCAPVVIQ